MAFASSVMSFQRSQRRKWCRAELQRPIKAKSSVSSRPLPARFGPSWGAWAGEGQGERHSPASAGFPPDRASDRSRGAPRSRLRQPASPRAPLARGRLGPSPRPALPSPGLHGGHSFPQTPPRMPPSWWLDVLGCWKFPTSSGVSRLHPRFRRWLVTLASLPSLPQLVPLRCKADS